MKKSILSFAALVVRTYDANISIPAIIAAYRTPEMTTKDSRVLDL
ncbi:MULTISPECIES: hypothetical protein [Polaribacter]|nr:MULTISPECIES: hypothetical protein [Polaribacter]MDO6740814.1 hypothetical protein [Polaribacter sp. 1_MG-2023]